MGVARLVGTCKAAEANNSHCVLVAKGMWVQLSLATITTGCQLGSAGAMPGALPAVQGLQLLKGIVPPHTKARSQTVELGGQLRTVY